MVVSMSYLTGFLNLAAYGVLVSLSSIAWANGTFVPCTNYPYYNCAVTGDGPPTTVFIPVPLYNNIPLPLVDESGQAYYGQDFYYNNQAPMPTYYNESNPYYSERYYNTNYNQGYYPGYYGGYYASKQKYHDDLSPPLYYNQSTPYYGQKHYSNNEFYDTP